MYFEDPLGPLGSSSSQHRRTPELVLSQSCLSKRVRRFATPMPFPDKGTVNDLPHPVLIRRSLPEGYVPEDADVVNAEKEGEDWRGSNNLKRHIRPVDFGKYLNPLSKRKGGVRSVYPLLTIQTKSVCTRSRLLPGAKEDSLIVADVFGHQPKALERPGLEREKERQRVERPCFLSDHNVIHFDTRCDHHILSTLDSTLGQFKSP